MKKLFTFVFLFCTTLIVHSYHLRGQNLFSLSLNKVENIDERIFKTLDTAMYYTQETYFYKLKQPYNVIFRVYSENNFTVYTNPTSIESINNDVYRTDWRGGDSLKRGYFIYKNIPIIVSMFVDSFPLFSISEIIDTIELNSSNNILDRVHTNNEKIRLHYKINDGEIIADYDKNIEGGRLYFHGENGRNDFLFIYVVQKGDTAESIAKKIGGSIEYLELEFMSIPKEGEIIAIYFNKLENRLGYTRVQ